MAALVAPPPPPLPYDHLRSTALSLYVGDLHPEVTEEELTQVFCRIGPLDSVHLCRDRLSHKSLRYAYINFFYYSDACKALACLNHTELKGKPIRIMWCQRDPLRRKTGIGNLFVKNLDPSITSALLEDIFRKFGTIHSCKVAEENGKSKGFGFVQFDWEESAIAALNALNGAMLEGKKLYVSKFVKKSERKDACEEPKFTNLYVKNMDEYLTEDLLRDKFSEYGEVCNVIIMKDGEGKSKGFGFINFESHEEAKKAMEALNGALIGSKNLFVGKPQKKVERKELLKRAYEEKLKCHTEKLKALNLYVKNLNLSIDDRKLEELFSAFGQVTSAKVMRHDNGFSKGFGFVSFSSPEEAKKALDSLNGSFVQGSFLYVAIAQRREERRKELQTYLAQCTPQSFYTSSWDILTPQFHPLHYSFPLLPPPNPVSHMNSCLSNTYQHVGSNDSAMHSFGAQNYHGNFSTYIPMRRSQLGNSKDWFYQQHSMRHSTSIIPMRGQKYGTRKDQKPSRKMESNRSGAAEASSKGSTATKGFISVSSPGKCNKNIGEVLLPLVEKLQPGRAAKITGMLLEMDKSDIQKLLNSPQTLAVQIAKAAQVKEANSWTG